MSITNSIYSSRRRLLLLLSISKPLSSSLSSSLSLSSLTNYNNRSSSSSTSYYKTIFHRIQQYGLPKLTIHLINQLLYISTNHNCHNQQQQQQQQQNRLSISIIDICVYCYHLAIAGDTIWNLNTYETISSEDTILQQAYDSNIRRMSRIRQYNTNDNTSSSSSLSLLDGIPISIKANIAVATHPFTAGSKILGGGGSSKCYKDNTSSTTNTPQHNTTTNTSNTSATTTNTNIVGYDANITNILLHQCNAILIGTTTMDEFGMGSFGTNYYYNTNNHNINTPRNPIPYLYPSINNNNNQSTNTSTNTTATTSTPWDIYNLIEFIKLPQDAINEIHYDLLSLSLSSSDRSSSSSTTTTSTTPTTNNHISTTNHNNNNDTTNTTTTSNENINITNNLRESDSNHDDDYYYSPGGSSCGSAISVCHGSSLISIGTDTGGSIRLPSTYCNVIGYKPSYGIISRYGIIPYANSFDTIGIIGTTMNCITTTYEHIINPPSSHELSSINQDNTTTTYNDNDKNHNNTSIPIQDSTQTVLSNEYKASIRDIRINLLNNNNTTTTTNNINNSDNSNELLKGITIGIPEAFSITECTSSSSLLRNVWECCTQYLQRHGATIQTIHQDVLSSKLIQQSLAAYYILACAEASSNLSRHDGLRYGNKIDMDVNTLIADNSESNNSIDNTTTIAATMLSVLEQQYALTRTELFGSEVIRRILCGTYVLSSDQYHTHYEAATQIRAQICQQFYNTFHKNTNSNNMNSSTCDLLLIPTTVYPPPKIHSSITIDPTEMFANDIMTIPISLTGYPAISISIKGSTWHTNHNHQSLPPFQIGMQLIGPRLSERNLLFVGSVLEKYVHQ